MAYNTKSAQGRLLDIRLPWKIMYVGDFLR